MGCSLQEMFVIIECAIILLLQTDGELSELLLEAASDKS